MVSQRISQEIQSALADLPEPLQQRVVDYARSLSRSVPTGVAGAELSRFAGAIPASDLEEMTQAIQAECERIDPHGW